MLKRLTAITIAFIILLCLSLTAFAGFDDGSGGATVPASAAAAARNSSPSKDTAQSESAKNKKSTYDDLKTTGSDAEFFAAIKRVLDEGKPVKNDLAIVEIKKPEKLNEKVPIYSKNFSISVSTRYEDVIFSVARLNSETGKYERIEFDREKSIKLACGLETKEAILEYGINKLLLISYRESEKQISKVQYNTIVVEVSKETADDKAAAAEKPARKTSSDPLDLDTFLDNLMGKGK